MVGCRSGSMHACSGAPCVNIFAGNLAFTTTEQDLRELFEPYGSVETIRIMTDRATGRSRGFGFVEMPKTTARRRQPLTPSTKHGRASRAGSHASRVSKPPSPSLRTTTALPSSRHNFGLGQCSQGRFCAVCRASPCAPGMGVHDNAVPPCLALGVGHDGRSSLMARPRRP
jgi:RNA recognition motif. (a.k.a. RRM, RBD, or RNP domain)